MGGWQRKNAKKGNLPPAGESIVATDTGKPKRKGDGPGRQRDTKKKGKKTYGPGKENRFPGPGVPNLAKKRSRADPPLGSLPW